LFNSKPNGRNLRFNTPLNGILMMHLLCTRVCNWKLWGIRKR